MKKLSLKWKFFLVFSYIQLITYGLVFLLLAFFVVNDKNTSSNDWVIFFFVSLGFTIVCFNNLFNIRAINRYFPDQLLPNIPKTMIFVLGVINIILLIGLIVTFSSGLNQELKIQKTQRYNKAIIISIFSCLLLFLIGLYTVILQFQMHRYLSRKNKDKLHSLINLIGKE